MYTQPDFKTKTNLEFAVAQGQIVTVHDSGPSSGGFMVNGEADVEGPACGSGWRWHARVIVVDGKVTKVK